MVAVLVLIGLIVALFITAFLSKRRFGILGLGLTAGAVISPLWSENAGYIVSLTGVVGKGPFVDAIAASLLILIPAVLFMFHGYSYKHIVARVVGSVLFTVVAVAFLIEPIGSILVFSGPVGDVYTWIATFKELIISGGVAIAVVDFLFARTIQKSDKKRR